MDTTPTHDSPPEWFTRAVSAPRESRVVEVAGCPIHYLRWGDPKRPGLLIVPPSGAHAHWYAHVGPLLADQFHVAVVDLAGCGDSGRRQAYTQELIIAEIMGVCADAGMLKAQVPPTLVGHSAGAQMAVRAALANDGALLGVIAVDGLRYAELEKDHALKILGGPRPAVPPPPRPPKVYAELAEAVAKFRLTPAPLAPIANTFIIDYIARNSFKQVEGGWTSKYDPAQVAPVTLAFELKDRLKDLKCHAAAIYAETTHLAEADVGDAMGALNDGKATVFVIPGTTHYPPLDSPFAFVAAVKGIALTWIADDRRAGTR